MPPTLNRLFTSLILALFMPILGFAAPNFADQLSCGPISDHLLVTKGDWNSAEFELRANQSPHAIKIRENFLEMNFHRKFGTTSKMFEKTAEVTAEEYKLFSSVKEVMNDYKAFVNFHIKFFYLLSENSAGGEITFANTFAVIREMARQAGFPTELLILDPKKGEMLPTKWRDMLNQGHLFIDSHFNQNLRKEQQNSHTETSHALQLLYVEFELQKRGYPKGIAREMLKKVSDANFVNKLSWKISEAERKVYEGAYANVPKYKDGYLAKYSNNEDLSPWFQFFDMIETVDTCSGCWHPSAPESFSYIAHDVYPAKVPLEEFSLKLRANWPP